MPLDQKDKELAAVGASIGANCRPCIEHHLAAGREAGLSQAELHDAVATARAVLREAAGLLTARIDIRTSGSRDTTGRARASSAAGTAVPEQGGPWS